MTQRMVSWVCRCYKDYTRCIKKKYFCSIYTILNKATRRTSAFNFKSNSVQNCPLKMNFSFLTGSRLSYHILKIMIRMTQAKKYWETVPYSIKKLRVTLDVYHRSTPGGSLRETLGYKFIRLRTCSLLKYIFWIYISDVKGVSRVVATLG